VKNDMVLGHESSGIVVDVGSEVKDLKKGDKVTMEPGVCCRRCTFCKTGRYNLCPDMQFMATPPYDGSLANFICHAADFCFKLPANVGFDEAAMCEPLSVGIHACNRAGVKNGSRVLIMGAGPIGLMCLLAAKAAGASKITIVDLAEKESRLKVANELGAFSIGIPKSPDSQFNISDKINELGSGPIDITIECSGAESAVTTAIKTTKSGGVVVLVGLGKPELTLPIVNAAVREIDIRGIFRYANCYPTALSMIESYQKENIIGKIISDNYKYKFNQEDVVKAFDQAKDPNSNAIKVVITINDNITWPLSS